MDSQTHLSAFISERLAAAAVEIFGAVEKTLIEHQREISRSKQEIDHLRSLVLWPQVRLHRSATHQLSPHCCDTEASPENRSRTLSPELQTTLRVKEELGQGPGRGALCRQQCDAPAFPQSVKRGRKDLPSHLYGILHVGQTAGVKAEPEVDGFHTSPSSREAEIHCGINAELCGLQQETLTDPLEITDHVQIWPDEQHCHEQVWSPCQDHEDHDSTQIKVEKFTSSTPQEATEHKLLTNQTCHPTEEERRDVGAIVSHCPAPQSEGGPVNGASFKQHPPSGMMSRRRKNSNLCYNDIIGFALEEDLSGLTKERRHTCSICTKRFKESSHLKDHVRIHTGEKPYQCTQCRMNFRQSGALTLHMRIHTGERPYQCNSCGRRFIRKGDMESHMVTHTGERPHLCLMCGKSYRRKSNLNTHLKIHAEGQRDCAQPL